MDLIPEPVTGQYLLAVLPHNAAGLLLRAAARMAWRSPLRVLDCGNRFNAYQVALELRRLQADPLEPALERIQVARAFTCYQVLTLLETAPALLQPTLVIDLLATFRDESVSLYERRRLLEAAIDHLRRLAQVAPLLVSVTPLGAAESVELADVLLTNLEADAGQVWRLTPPPPALPMRLFYEG